MSHHDRYHDPTMPEDRAEWDAERAEAVRRQNLYITLWTLLMGAACGAFWTWVVMEIF